MYVCVPVAVVLCAVVADSTSPSLWLWASALVAIPAAHTTAAPTMFHVLTVIIVPSASGLDIPVWPDARKSDTHHAAPRDGTTQTYITKPPRANPLSE